MAGRPALEADGESASYSCTASGRKTLRPFTCGLTSGSTPGSTSPSTVLCMCRVAVSLRFEGATPNRDLPAQRASGDKLRALYQRRKSRESLRPGGRPRSSRVESRRHRVRLRRLPNLGLARGRSEVGQRSGGRKSEPISHRAASLPLRRVARVQTCLESRTRYRRARANDDPLGAASHRDIEVAGIHIVGVQDYHGKACSAARF
jgi:hypothetical protein